MALAYEDEARKRKALMGQMSSTPDFGQDPPPPPLPTEGGLPPGQTPPIQQPTVEPTRTELPESGLPPTFRRTPQREHLPGSIPGIREGENDPNSSSEPPPVVDAPVVSPTAPPVEGVPRTPDSVNTGQPKPNFGRVMGMDEGKFNDPNKHDFKYDVIRKLSEFDPRQGFTPEVIAALNALGYGTFSSKGGDKLTLTGATGSPDAADFADQDWIFAHDAQNDATKWNFGGGGAAGASAGGGVDNNPGTNYANTSSGASASDYPPEMQNALNNGLVPTDNSYFMKLMDQLRQQSGTPDRKALLSLMKQ